jgi:hypothetical protein
MLISQFPHFSFVALMVVNISVLQTPSIAADNETAGNIFSTPDAQATPPTFKGHATTFQNTNNQINFSTPITDPPSREELVTVPSLTGVQRKQIDQIYSHQANVVQTLRDEIASLNRILKEKQDAAKTNGPPLAPDIHQSVMASMDYMSPDTAYGATAINQNYSVDSLKARIQTINHQITDQQAQSWQQIQSLLGPQQLNDLQQMRQGALVISSNSNTNVPDPSQKPPVSNLINQAPKLIRPSLGSPVGGLLINTTQQVLRSTVLRF